MSSFLTTTDYISDCRIYFGKQQRSNKFTINYMYIQKRLQIFKIKNVLPKLCETVIILSTKVNIFDTSFHSMFIPEKILLMMDNLGLDEITSPLDVQSNNVGVVSINKTMKLP